MPPGPDKVVFFGLATTGSNPFESQIITIQARTEGRTTIWAAWETSERRVIDNFLTFTDQLARKSTTFVGYGLLRFDLPFLVRRMNNRGMLTDERWRRLHQEINWFDMYLFLGDQFSKFREWNIGPAGRALEAVHKGIPQLYERKEYDKIVKYIIDDMEGCERVYQALQKEEFYEKLITLRKRLV